ncbi:hypothetical protein D9M71_486140 [compost metagenome]
MQAIEQVAGTADHQLQAAFRQQAGGVHQAHYRLGQVAGRGRWLDDARHAGQESRSELFQHAPDGEVEGVDVHRDTGAWHQDVAAGEVALLAQRDGRAFVHQVARGQLAAADTGIGEQRGVTAFDVDPAVGAGGAAVVGQGVELFLVLGQVQGQGLEALGALLEIHAHQCGKAAGAGIVHGFGEVRAFFVAVGKHVAIEGTAQGLGAVLADPAAGDEALQGRGGRHAVLHAVRM